MEGSHNRLDEFGINLDILPRLAYLKSLDVTTTSNNLIVALLSKLCDPEILQ